MQRAGAVRRILHDNGLSLALLALFVLFLFGQSLAGLYAYNEEQAAHGEPALRWVDYLRSAHFAEATFENWESEFLQMGAYVLLTALLFQRGSAESNDPDEPSRPGGTRPGRARGLRRVLYENSLLIAFVVIFIGSFLLHARSGAALHNEEQLQHGLPALGFGEYVGTSQFWFESFQNWQSEFLAILAMVVLTILLRQKGSSQSKDVDAPHRETGS